MWVTGKMVWVSRTCGSWIGRVLSLWGIIVISGNEAHHYCDACDMSLGVPLPPRVGVMVCPLTLYDLPKPRTHLQQLGPFPNLVDRPLTYLSCQPTSHSLSLTLICSHYPSLLDILNPPCLYFDLQPSTLTRFCIPDFQTLSLTTVQSLTAV